MKLTFRGHDDRYAVEQSLLAFFPEERPVYEGEDGESHAEVTLREGGTYAVGVTVLTYGGKKARGEARVRVAGVSDEYERERLRQRALKLSFFRAAREVTGVTPSWGALTGIRPAKLVRGMMEGGHDRRPSRPGAAGDVLRVPGTAATGVGERGGGAEGEKRVASGGDLPLYRDPLLPDAVRLLQLRVRVGGEVL